MIIGDPLRRLGGAALLLAAAATTAVAQPTDSSPVVRDHRSGAWQPVPRGYYRPGYDKHGEKPAVRDHRPGTWQPKCGRYSCSHPPHGH
jgi:hypothetical protein